jgi:uncharacterized protein YecE (DUF72 family)
MAITTPAVTQRQLSAEAEWITGQLSAGIDVYAYFNNDAQGYAAKNAATLKILLADRRSAIK